MSRCPRLNAPSRRSLTAFTYRFPVSRQSDKHRADPFLDASLSVPGLNAWAKRNKNAVNGWVD